MVGASAGRLGLLLAVLLGAAPGCLPDAPGLACGVDGASPRCTTPGSECRAGYCAVRAADCASGWRFTETAAAPGVCVPASDADAGAVDVQAVDDVRSDDRPSVDDVPPEAGIDAPTVDLGVDAGVGVDVVTDLGVRDTGADVADAGVVVDTGADAQVDVTADLGQPDAGMDAGRADAGFDAGRPDAGMDAGRPDAGFDAGAVDVPAPDVSRCQPGETLCAERCHTLSSSQDHCGACGNRCPLGEACAAGVCVCGVGQVRCGGVCAPTGACMSAGAGGCAQAGTRRCVNGVMVCDAMPRTSGPCSSPSGGQCSRDGSCVCPPGRALCDGACRDLQSDLAHCGRCNNACSNNLVCLQGLCVQGCVVQDGTSGGRTSAPRCLTQNVCPGGLVCTGQIGVCLPAPCNVGSICLGMDSCTTVMLQVTCGVEVEAVRHARCQGNDKL